MPGGWGDVIAAAAGGAAGGGAQAMQFQEGLDRKKQLDEIKAMLAQVSEEGRNTRAAQTDSTRRYLGDETNETRNNLGYQASADRAAALKQKTDASNEALSQGWSKIQDTSDRGWAHIGDTEQGQADANDRFWGGTMPLGYTRDATSTANNQRTTATSRANALTGAATSTGNAGTAAATADKNRRARNVLDVLKMRQKDSSSLLGGSDDPTDWADEADKLYNDPGRLAGEALQRSGAAPVAPAAVPVGPKGAAPEASAGSAAQSAKTVTLAELQRVAASRGTTVDAERARAISAGYAVVR